MTTEFKPVPQEVQQKSDRSPTEVSLANPPAVTQQHINWIVIGLMVLVFLLIIIKNIF